MRLSSAVSHISNRFSERRFVKVCARLMGIGGNMIHRALLNPGR